MPIFGKCCGCDLKSGNIVIGVLYLIGALGSLVMFSSPNAEVAELGFDFGISAIANPQYLIVSSTGPASTEWSFSMGIYSLQENYVNGFPVWKKQGEDKYLFVDGDGYWGIRDNLASTGASICLPEKDPTPKLPVNIHGWEYAHIEWKTDYSIRVEFSDYNYKFSTTTMRTTTGSDFGISAVANPQYLTLSSTGESSIQQSNRMGIYSLQEKPVNGFPVWKKQGEELYLFVDTDGFWGIGDNLASTEVYIYLPGKDPTPKSPVNGQGWEYAYSKRETDSTLRVEGFTENNKGISHWMDFTVNILRLLASIFLLLGAMKGKCNLLSVFLIIHGITTVLHILKDVIIFVDSGYNYIFLMVTSSLTVVSIFLWLFPLSLYQELQHLEKSRKTSSGYSDFSLVGQVEVDFPSYVGQVQYPSQVGQVQYTAQDPPPYTEKTDSTV